MSALTQSGCTERFLSDMLCRTPLASSCPEHWKGGTISCFLWNIISRVPAAKHACLGMVCCNPAQFCLRHASTAKNNVSSLFLLLGYGCRAWTHNWVQDGTSSNPSQALLVPFLTAGWAKCRLVWGFALFNPGNTVLCLVICPPVSDKPQFEHTKTSIAKG